MPRRVPPSRRKKKTLTIPVVHGSRGSGDGRNLSFFVLFPPRRQNKPTRRRFNEFNSALEATVTLPCNAAAPSALNDITLFAVARECPCYLFGKATEVVPEPTSTALSLLALAALEARCLRRK